MNNPKISVIIPAYNAEKMIERCLYSLLYQIFEDFTVIIVNDGSTDNTLDVINLFVEKDSRFKVISQENQGASVARNTGYINSVSEFVTFVDADDVLTIDALKTLYEHINRNSNDYVIGAKKQIHLNGKMVDFLPRLFEKNIDSVSASNTETLNKIKYHIAPHGKLIRRSFLEKHKIRFVEYWTYEDFLYSYTLLLSATSIGIVADNCYYYINNSDSISNAPLKTHNILSRIVIEKLIWKLCLKKDPKKLIFKNVKKTTFKTRFYRNIKRIGLDTNFLHKSAFYVSKEIIYENINTIVSVTSGIKKMIYLGIYYLEFEEFCEFRQEVKTLGSEFVKLKKGNINVICTLSGKLGSMLILKILQNNFKNLPAPSKIWLYKEQVTVIDFLLEKNQVAFDIIINEEKNFLEIWVFSRNMPKSLASLEKVALSSSGNRYLIYRCNIYEIEKAVESICEYIEKIKVKKINNRDNIEILTDMKLLTQELKYENKKIVEKLNISKHIENSFTIKDVLKREICIGCGGCAIITEDKIKIEKNSYGIYEASVDDIESLSEEELHITNAVCPFSNMSLNENQLDVPNETYKSLPYNETIGRYDAIFTAKKIDEKELLESSSGGMTSWLIKKLFQENKIDAVVHVGRTTGENLFEYKISYSIEEAEANKKSAYYSITLKDVLIELKKKNHLRYAIVGLPCMIKSTRLLAEKDSIIGKSIIYYLGLVCGHLKSSFFAESNAWQCGVNPKDLKSVDFRVKNKSNPASRYDFSAVSKTTGETFSKKSSSLFGGSWGYAGFQPNACNYCDDIFAETADIVFADAWLSEYTKDWSGTNLVVSRNQELSSLFNSGLEEHEIKIKNVTVKDAIKSQAGGIRHRKDGLKIRLYNDLQNDLKVPHKRVNPSIDNIADNRVELIKQRQNISKLSLEYFRIAKEKNNFNNFTENLKGEISLYSHIKKLTYPKVSKKNDYDIALFGWYHNKNLGGSLTVFALHQLLKANSFSVKVVQKPKAHKITDGNRANRGIVDSYYSYAESRSFEKLHELREYCNTFVLASDQLWAGKWIEFKPEFEFLASGDKSVKKISVATSFGGDGKFLPFDNDKKEIVKYHLRNIDYISVREPSGVDILKNEGIKGTQILDPVFLCSGSVYKDLISKSKLQLNKERYVAGYILDLNESLLNFATVEVADKLNLKYNIFTTTMAHTKKKNDIVIKKWALHKDVNFYPYPSIAEFIHMISKASFVVTDSFHGACICVIFNKPFICAAKKSRGASRFSLFDKLGLSDRIVDRNNLNIDVLQSEINWDKVNRELYEMRLDSFEWLSNAFGKKMQYEEE